ncbi:MAG: type I DNA topoisomerase [Flavobacteriales bacterium]|nr:type I DNA topoisomerase [Flavobacteriales bacterium]
MAKNLVIVESPAKAKTIEGFLGKDFQVESSFGHISDLVSKDMGIDISNNFKPIYEVSKDKKDVVKKLKKLSKDAETVWLASDEDREGEAIAWHLFENLNLKKEQTKRIVFHEITKNAITKAIENPREIDYNLVNAQQARRVLDRLVGFEISPVLWRKIKAGLSAGRVQSVAVRLIVEKEEDIKKFSTASVYRVIGEFINSEGKLVRAEYPTKFDNKEDALNFLEGAKNSGFKVAEVVKKPAKRTPSAPFTTSTLQQEASRKLGFGVSKTMVVAQRLYESGMITYMRTDSLNLSEDAIKAAEKNIAELYGEEYSKPRRFATKNKGAQEAHEAIRPTNLMNQTAGGENDQKRLYELIWKRTIASQMSDAQLERTTAKISGSKIDSDFTAKGEVILFDGFLKVYLEGTDDEDNEEQKGMLPKLSADEKMIVSEIVASERFSKPPSRFTEASLVKKLEELGIGRPSTYAPTISTIQRREYIEKLFTEGNKREVDRLVLKDSKIQSTKISEGYGAEKGKLAPTDIGTVVNGFLVENFQDVLDYGFTRSVEEEFDLISEGKAPWTEMISEFYSGFHEKVEDVKENSERASGERIIGVDEETGHTILVRIGRYGPMAQIGTPEEVEKPKFASLRKDQSISTITLEEIKDLFKLPRDLGTYEDKKVVVAIGRFGPYVRHDSKFVSIKAKDGDDPLTIELPRCIELIEEKRQADREKFIKAFTEEEPLIEILKGRWGPYIKIGKKNVKIPKDTDPLSLTREDCLELEVESDKVKKGGKKAAPKKAAPKKVTAKKPAAKKPAAKKPAAKKPAAKKTVTGKTTKKK